MRVMATNNCACLWPIQVKVYFSFVVNFSVIKKKPRETLKEDLKRLTCISYGCFMQALLGKTLFYFILFPS